MQMIDPAAFPDLHLARPMSPQTALRLAAVHEENARLCEGYARAVWRNKPEQAARMRSDAAALRAAAVSLG